jgi:predicted exporter
MSYARKNSNKVFGSIAVIMGITAIGVWQFYRFVTFTNEQGVVDLQGGRGHLWWAIAMAIVACVAAFFVFSVFMRHDTDDELHITS